MTRYHVTGYPSLSILPLGVSSIHKLNNCLHDSDLQPLLHLLLSDWMFLSAFPTDISNSTCQKLFHHSPKEKKNLPLSLCSYSWIVLLSLQEYWILSIRHIKSSAGDSNLQPSSLCRSWKKDNEIYVTSFRTLSSPSISGFFYILSLGGGGGWNLDFHLGLGQCLCC